MDTCNFSEKKEMNIVIVGHVDHGKSTVIGRLLADTGSLPEGKLEMIKELCRRNSKPFEYAFLLDALKDERAQGITIDTARSFFQTEKRKYIIIDAPGHIEFLKNMITGASRAEAALLVIDAHEGIQENSRRHGYMLSMLGIKQVTVLINKLDLVLERDRQRYYEDISREYASFLEQIGMKPAQFIPISATEGYNIAKRSETMPWYTGQTVLEALDAFNEVLPSDDLPFRMWVQDVYKFTSDGDDRRIIAGSVSSGIVSEGDEITFYPSGKKTTVSSIEAFNEPKKTKVTAGYATGLCMKEQIYAKRGELIAIDGQKEPLCSDAVKTSVFWLGKEPMRMNKSYKLKIGSAQVGCKIEKIIGVLNASTLENTVKNSIERHEVARCVLRLDRNIAFDISGMTDDTSRFVIVDGYEISGGGIITDVASEERSYDESDSVSVGAYVSKDEREHRNGHKAVAVFVSGNEKNSPAAELERALFDKGMTAGAVMNTSSQAADETQRITHVCSALLNMGITVLIDEKKFSPETVEFLKASLEKYGILSLRISDNAEFSELDFNAKTIEQAVSFIEDSIRL